MTEKMRDGIIKRGAGFSYDIRERDPQTGTSKPRWVSGFPTRKAAREARDAAQAESDSPKGRPKITLYSLDWPRDRIFAVARLTALSETKFIQHIVRQHPLRTIAEARAKSQMVSLHSEDDEGDCTCCGEPYPCRSLRIIAEIFDEEPDFDQEWRYEEY